MSFTLIPANVGLTGSAQRAWLTMISLQDEAFLTCSSLSKSSPSLQISGSANPFQAREDVF